MACVEVAAMKLAGDVSEPAPLEVALERRIEQDAPTYQMTTIATMITADGEELAADEARPGAIPGRDDAGCPGASARIVMRPPRSARPQSS